MEIFFVILGALLLSVTVFLLGKPKKERKKEKDFNYFVNVPLQYTIDQVPVSLKDIQKRDSDFDPNYFLFTTFCLLRDAQKAWSDRNLNHMKIYFGPRLYEVYERVIKDFSIKGQKNIISDMLLLNSKLCSLSFEGNREIAEVLMTVSCYDYLVATASHRIVTGSNERKLAITYILKLERIRPASDELVICANCKQPMKEKHVVRCPFCNAEMIPKSYDWVIIDKRVLKETEF